MRIFGELILHKKNQRKPRRHQPNKGSKQARRGERCYTVPSDTSIANSDPTLRGRRLWLEDDGQQSTGMIDEICFNSNEGGIRRGALSFRQFISALEGFYSQSIRNDELPLGLFADKQLNKFLHLKTVSMYWNEQWVEPLGAAVSQTYSLRSQTVTFVVVVIEREVAEASINRVNLDENEFPTALCSTRSTTETVQQSSTDEMKSSGSCKRRSIVW